MNAQTLIEETKKKAKEIEKNIDLAEIFILYRQFAAAYELCEGDDDQIEDLKDIKNHLNEAYDDALDLIKALNKVGRK